MGFKLGDTVYIRTDPDQSEGIITSITEYLGGSITYAVSGHNGTTAAYGVELSRDIDEVKRLGINQKQE